MSYRTNQDQDFLDKVSQLQEEITESRREFFKQAGKGAAATAVATTAFHMGIRPYMKPLAADADAAIGSSVNSTIAGVAEGGWKAHFNIKPNYTYMNVGTTGSLPVTVLDQMEEWYNEVSEQSLAYNSNVPYQVNAVLPASGAAGYNAYGCKPHEMIYTWTTTDGMLRLVAGIDWKAGDKVMSTNMEHVGGLGPMYSMENYYGIQATPLGKYRWVNPNTGVDIPALTDPFDNSTASENAVLVGINMEDAVNYGNYQSSIIYAPTGIRDDPTQSFGMPSYAQYKSEKSATTATYDYDTFWFNNDTIAAGTISVNPLRAQLSSAAGKLGSNLKSFIFSSPPYLTGIRFPEKHMCNHTDSLNGGNVSTVVDAAHLPGMININLHDMGCDFFAGSGHKWQCGPGQTGYGYIRNGKGTEQSWSVAADGITRSGSSPAYSTNKALPKFWVMSTAYAKAADIAKGERVTSKNMGDAIMSIGNNSIPISRAVYETVNLWNTIGRQKIEDYVVYLAQRLRCHLANAPLVGELNTLLAQGGAAYVGTNDSQSGLYGLGIDPRAATRVGTTNTWLAATGPSRGAFAAGGWSTNLFAMNDMLDPSTHRADMPTWAKCGLTPYSPWIYDRVNDGTGLATNAVNSVIANDYNRPLTAKECLAQQTRNPLLLGHLNDRYGVFTRNTSVPNQCRFNQPGPNVNTLNSYSLNNQATYASRNCSTPLRWSTHLFHTVTEIDNVGDIFALENLQADGEMARLLQLDIV